MSEDNAELGKIYRYLELDKADGRLKLKANIMKKILILAKQWKIGLEIDWIDKMANRTCVSTRKMRENYVQPLVTEGIFQKLGNGNIRFVGLPDCAEMPTELTEEQLVEELNEENANRIALGKKPFTMKQWKEQRKTRLMPVQ